MNTQQTDRETFEQYLSRNPYPGTRSFTKDDWESSMWERWSQENGMNLGTMPETNPVSVEVIQHGMKVKHDAIKEVLTVVADEQGPAYTGNEFKDDVISLTHAIQEYKKGRLKIESGELKCTPGEWYVVESYAGRGIYSAHKTGSSTKTLVGAAHGLPENKDANAHLFAASKKLYEALLNLMKVAGETTANLIAWDGAEVLDKAIDEAEEVIKKANPNYKP